MPANPKWPRIVLGVLQSIQALTLLPWLMMAAFAVMAFDAPGSEKLWQPWAFVLAIWSYPLWLLLAGIVSWVLHFRGWNVTAVLVAGLFTLPVPAVLILIGW
ncbi:MAG: hypothetical protein IAE97_11750 [Chthoniobacterales bacterium]|nr:hypothetical protein [Chthoniobacterales bacterium]